MQVMNNDQFTQNEILIGGTKKTVGFKVSDDPMLMSMLSTGFYANPHRAMIQEVMFNAWDAHRMGKCQDKAIDIYINEESGFVVRDYGPGIHDQMMGDVYCTYAASTKRDDEDQTGGFGLGSKSPWSYTESFTVTSHHLGTKTMYLMSRVSDDAGGKPGMTELMSFPTKETGLSVSVPLLVKDISNTYTIVKDVLYLSGIKANIHYKENNVEYVNSVSVSPSQYIMTEPNRGHSHYNFMSDKSKLFAVYGGVKYEIPSKEEYTEEFAFIKAMSSASNIYIGFAPHTLSPLPNREGLNMNSKTKENIKIGLELCMERFQVVLEPLIHAYFRDKFDKYIQNGIEPHFALYNATCTHNDRYDYDSTFTKKMVNLAPLDIDKGVWKIALSLLQINPHLIINTMTKKKWLSIICTHFVRVYPESKHLAFKLLKENTDNVIVNSSHTSHSSYANERLIASWVMPNQIKKLNQFESEMAKAYPDDISLSKPKLRMYDNGTDKWEIVLRNKPALQYDKKNSTLQKAKIDVRDIPNSIDKIWNKNSNSEILQFLASNIVILAKTVESLSFNENVYLGVIYNNQNCTPSQYKSKNNFYVVPAYVVHSRKGAYAKAVEIFTNMGFKVIETPEIVKQTKTTSKKDPIITNQYHRINVRNDCWKEEKGGYLNSTFEGEPLTNPTHYLYLTKSDINYMPSYGKNHNAPDKKLVQNILKFYPDIAMVNTQLQVDKLKNSGVKPFVDCVKDWQNKLETNVYRIRNLVRVSTISTNMSIPFELLHYPSIQKAFGVASIKEDDIQFWQEVEIINAIKNENWDDLREQTKAMQLTVATVWKNDPQKDRINEAIITSGLFSDSSISRIFRNLDTVEKENLANNIARFIRNG